MVKTSPLSVLHSPTALYADPRGVEAAKRTLREEFTGVYAKALRVDNEASFRERVVRLLVGPVVDILGAPHGAYFVDIKLSHALGQHTVEPDFALACGTPGKPLAKPHEENTGPDYCWAVGTPGLSACLD